MNRAEIIDQIGIEDPKVSDSLNRLGCLAVGTQEICSTCRNYTTRLCVQVKEITDTMVTDE